MDLYNNKTEFVILCNFDEFHVYNWYYQRDPVSIFALEDLPRTWRSLAFLHPKKTIRPIFNNDLVAVTKEAAENIARLYSSLIERGIEQGKAQVFTLQCLTALFAEDMNLFPMKGFFYDLINDCKNGESSYDLFYLLFKQMNSKTPASGGRFKGVKFFNGGIFKKVYKIDLTNQELELLLIASTYNWAKVQPSIFGNIFENSLGEVERHETGSHYTAEIDILRMIEPTLIKPFRLKIESLRSLEDYAQIIKELSNLKILDPACGSGNFLYVAFREITQLELDLLRKITEKFASARKTTLHSSIDLRNFFGIDINPFAIELAKITLSFAIVIMTREFNKFNQKLKSSGWIDYFDPKDPLPFEDLDKNFSADDALVTDWPEVNIIIGNPPFQSKNKIQQELGADYIRKIRDLFPDVSGMADYCVYWFRKAHDHLPYDGRAGLVGTNTISQTNSRKGGLDYITANNGIIIDAVKTMPWPGAAVVYVSIVNWIKSKTEIKTRKTLRELAGDKGSEWQEYELGHIPSSLSHQTDVSQAEKLEVNKDPKTCFQGQTHGHSGFLLKIVEKRHLLKSEPEAIEAIFPYLNARNFITNVKSQPKTYVIDFFPLEIYEAQKYKKTFKIVEDKVLPTRKERLEQEKRRNEKVLKINPKAKVNRHHANFYKKWWQLSYPRGDLLEELKKINRYIVISQVSRRPIFDFISTNIHPNAALIVFTFEDDYSYGILQSVLHWEWIKARCSTLKGDYRYTSSTVYESLPWPQWGELELLEKNSILLKEMYNLVLNVAKQARDFRELRNKIRNENKWSLLEVHKSLEMPGKHPLKSSLDELNNAVWNAYYYGLPDEMKTDDPLKFLFQLNLHCSEREKKGLKIIGPGLPEFCGEASEFYSNDAIDIISK